MLCYKTGKEFACKLSARERCLQGKIHLVYTAADRQDSALPLYSIQLIFNFFWSIFFFNMQWYLFSFVWLLLLWLLILLTTMRFFQSTRAAGYLMLPYLFWVTFAGYLNFGVYLMNR